MFFFFILQAMENFKFIPNPFPVPYLLEEGKWIKGGPVLGNDVNPNLRNWSAKLNVHERLLAHQTLNSARKNARYVLSSKVPQDSLDLKLTSIYFHDFDLFVPKSYVNIQPESIHKPTWRVLKNKIKVHNYLRSNACNQRMTGVLIK